MQCKEPSPTNVICSGLEISNSLNIKSGRSGRHAMAWASIFSRNSRPRNRRSMVLRRKRAMSRGVRRKVATLKRHVYPILMRISTFMRWSIKQLWCISRSTYWYLSKEFLPSMLCLVASYIGVCLSFILPASMWAWLAIPALAQFASIPVTTFPLAELPSMDSLARALLAAIPLAIRVFATGSYKQWNKSSETLGARLLFACHSGII